ncbi:hypothetical protein RAH32_18285 [Paracoccus sp. WLY502]|uniref:hypothetical protein n=1 Tax=Paracoccus yibinensis TaxID=3068891 RepID=UPI002796D8B8|nr:hypothetical protein [Paracoccus sp. WLY502]MDQ1902372.1 hypothetical protein [Paracoccus sp. WLY502]
MKVHRKIIYLILLVCFVQSNEVLASATCPLQYSHEEPDNEDPAAVAARIAGNISLGTYKEVKRAEATEIEATLNDCINLHESTDSELDDLYDAKTCVTEFSVIFLDIYQELSNNGDAHARQKAYQFFLEQWSFLFANPESGALVSCNLVVSDKLSAESLARLETEVLLVMGISTQRRDRNIGYWRALLSDIISDTGARCQDGCSRLFWLRGMLPR